MKEKDLKKTIDKIIIAVLVNLYKVKLITLNLITKIIYLLTYKTDCKYWKIRNKIIKGKIILFHSISSSKLNF